MPERGLDIPVGSELALGLFPDVNKGLNNSVFANYAKPEIADYTNSYIPNLKFGYDGKVIGTENTLTPNMGEGISRDSIEDWFSKNKSMLGAGVGLGQLGLGYLNYRANKRGLESDLASAEQERRLKQQRAENKLAIQNKAQSALKWS